MPTHPVSKPSDVSPIKLYHAEGRPGSQAWTGNILTLAKEADKAIHKSQTARLQAAQIIINRADARRARKDADLTLKGLTARVKGCPPNQDNLKSPGTNLHHISRHGIPTFPNVNLPPPSTNDIQKGRRSMESLGVAIRNQILVRNEVSNFLLTQLIDLEQFLSDFKQKRYSRLPPLDSGFNDSIERALVNLSNVLTSLNRDCVSYKEKLEELTTHCEGIRKVLSVTISANASDGERAPIESYDAARLCGWSRRRIPIMDLPATNVAAAEAFGESAALCEASRKLLTDGKNTIQSALQLLQEAIKKKLFENRKLQKVLISDEDRLTQEIEAAYASSSNVMPMAVADQKASQRIICTKTVLPVITSTIGTQKKVEPDDQAAFSTFTPARTRTILRSNHLALPTSTTRSMRTLDESILKLETLRNEVQANIISKKDLEQLDNELLAMLQLFIRGPPPAEEDVSGENASCRASARSSVRSSVRTSKTSLRDSKRSIASEH